MLGIIPRNLAFTIIPIVPVYVMPSLAATLRALMSSSISMLSGFSKAKAIALDSPLSI